MQESHESPPTNEPAPAWDQAGALGFDLSLLEANLRLTPQERIRQHARALETAYRLRDAMDRARAGSRVTT